MNFKKKQKVWGHFFRLGLIISPYLILLMSLLISLFVYYLLLQKFQQKEKEELQQSSQKIVATVKKSLDMYVNSLAQTRAFFMVQPRIDFKVNQLVLNKYFEQASLLQRYPGTLGIGVFSQSKSSEKFSPHSLIYFWPEKLKGKFLREVGKMGGGHPSDHLLISLPLPLGTGFGSVVMLLNIREFFHYLTVSWKNKLTGGISILRSNEKSPNPILYSFQHQGQDGRNGQNLLRVIGPQFRKKVILDFNHQSWSFIITSLRESYIDKVYFIPWMGGALSFLLGLFLPCILLFYRRQVISDSFINMITNSLPILISYVDSQFKIRFSNNSLKKLLFASPEEILGKRVDEVFEEKIYQEFEPYLQEALWGKQAEFEKEIFCLPYPPRHLKFNLIPHLDQQQKVLGVFIMVEDISKRKKEEEILRKTQEKLNLVISHVPLVLWSVDHNGIFTLSEGKGLEILGMQSGEIVGKSVFDFYNENFLITELVKLTLQGFKQQTEVKVGDMWFESYFFPLFNKQNKSEGVVGVAFDITRSKEMAICVQESREQYQRLIEKSSIVAWEADISTFKLLYIGPQVHVMLGYHPEEWYNDDSFWVNHIYHEDRSPILQYLHQMAQKNFHFEMEYRMVKSDGNIIWVRDYISVLERPEGKKLLTGFMVDINEQKNLAIELQEQKKKFDALLDSSLDHIFMLDFQGKFLFVNQATSNFLGISQAKILNHSVQELGLPLEFFSLFQQAYEGETVKAEIPFTSPKNKSVRYFEYVLGPLLSDEAKVTAVVCVARDVHERKMAERKLEEALLSKDEFLSIASHELKTPLTSLKLQLQMMRRQLLKERLIEQNAHKEESEEKNVFMLNSALKQVDRLANIIEDLLDVVLIQEGKIIFTYEKINLSYLVREVLDRLDEQFVDAGVFLHLSLEEPVELYCDQGRIDQVIGNLLANAIKYGGGKPVYISVYKQGGMAYLEVKDSGIGIQKEKLGKIFGKFERGISSRNISGLGLGLYIIQRIIDAHGGYVKVESEVGVGSCFLVEIPLKGSFLQTTAKYSSHLRDEHIPSKLL